MPARDASSFSLVKTNKVTGRDLIEGQRTIIGAEKAQWEQQRLIADLTESEKAAGWTWAARPNSQMARRRMAFGFRPDMSRLGKTTSKTETLGKREAERHRGIR
jgi:hypothetical protein